jgi:hypothetical protein
MTTGWFFPPNNGGEESGLNDAGIQTLKTSGYLARETLQNSGDAHVAQNEAPVRVTFTRLLLDHHDFPGAQELLKVIRQARHYILGQCTREQRRQNGEEFFDTAIDALSRRRIPVLRISDFNTTGLHGSDSLSMSPWYRLIRQQGTASMHGAGGGTFGIGQRAPFAYSSLRTVFYTTQTESNGFAFIGKSILSSFHDGREVRRPVGYWGELRDSFVAPLTDVEALPEVFRRYEQGLDLFITGYSDETWPGSVTRSALRNFFVAFADGKLELELYDGADRIERIDRVNVDDRMDFYLEDDPSAARLDGLHTARFFLDAWRNPHGGGPIVESLERLGQVKLYVFLSPDAPNRVAFMRRPRILVEDKGKTVINGYAGLFLCDNEQGNKLLAGLEDPSHTKWDRSRPGGQGVLNEINRFVREALSNLVQRDIDTEEDVPDLARYLPDDAPDSTGVFGLADTHTDDITELETGEHQQIPGRLAVRRTRRAPAVGRQRTPDSSGSRDGQLGTTGAGTSGGSGTGPGGGDDPGAGRGPHGSEGDNLDGLSRAEIGFRAFFDAGSGIYRVVLWSQRPGEADVTLLGAGDAGEFPMRIAAVTDSDGLAIPFEGNRLKRVALSYDRRVLLVTFEAQRRLALTIGVGDATR